MFSRYAFVGFCTAFGAALLLTALMVQPSFALLGAPNGYEFNQDLTHELPPTPTPQPSPTPQQTAECTGLTVEAEDGLLAGTFVAVEDELASGGSYIHVPPSLNQEPDRDLNDDPTAGFNDSSANNRALRNRDNYAEFCFIVSQAGKYRLRAVGYAANFTANSFEITLGENQDDLYIWALSVNSENDFNYRLDYVSADGGLSPLEVDLPTGEHTIRFYEREAGTRLDKLELEFTGDNQPPDLGHPGDQQQSEGDFKVVFVDATDADEDTLTYSAAGLPAGLTIEPSTGAITGVLEDGSAGSYNVFIYVDDGTSLAIAKSTWQVDADPSADCGGMFQEAEDGMLFGKMVVGSDEEASGGSYVSSPSTQSDPADESTNEVQAQSISRKHRADYCVTIPKTTAYRLRAQIYAPTAIANSFYVQANGAPSSGYLWDIFPIESSYNTDYVSERYGNDPVLFFLSKGTHIISFVSRENDARLDSFTVEPVSVRPVQTQSPTPQQLAEDLAQQAVAGLGTFTVFTPFVMQ